LSALGQVALHGCAAAFERGAFGILGETGAGKSTLAAAFSRNGVPVLTDDCLVVDKDGDTYYAQPSYPEIRLWPDALDRLFDGAQEMVRGNRYSDKMRLSIGVHGLAYATNRVPLRALFFIDEPGPKNVLTLEPMRPTDASFRVLGSMFRMLPVVGKARGEEFQAVTDLVASIPCFTLGYPKQIDQLDSTVRAVLEQVERIHS
ncbi:MAG: hypothetical protein WBW88_11000, partial [Rhodothermales bacterium]